MSAGDGATGGGAGGDGGERAAGVRVHPPLVFLGALVLGGVLGWLVPWRAPAPRGLLVAVGLALVVAGLALGGSAFRLMRRSGQDPNPKKPSPSLLGAGPYRFTRNPMYVGLTAVEIGLGLALDDLWIVLFSVPALVIVHVFVVLREEQYLTDKFGDDYRRYRSSVRRYL